MAVTINRSERHIHMYVPSGQGHRVAAGLQARGWKLRMDPWNDKDDLLRIGVRKSQTEDDFVADLEAAFPGEDFKIDIEDQCAWPSPYFGRDEE